MGAHNARFVTMRDVYGYDLYAPVAPVLSLYAYKFSAIFPLTDSPATSVRRILSPWLSSSVLLLIFVFYHGVCAVDGRLMKTFEPSSKELT